MKDLQQTEQISTVESDKNKPSVKPSTRKKNPYISKVRKNWYNVTGKQASGKQKYNSRSSLICGKHGGKVTVKNIARQIGKDAASVTGKSLRSNVSD